jgi:hypothetical protein
MLACALAQAYRARAFANAILSDVRKLRVGRSTYDDVLKVQAQYKSASSVESDSCDRALCGLFFERESMVVLFSYRAGCKIRSELNNKTRNTRQNQSVSFLESGILLLDRRDDC